MNRQKLKLTQNQEHYVTEERLNIFPQLAPQEKLSNYIYDFIVAIILRYQLVDYIKKSTSPAEVNAQCFAILNKIVELEKNIKAHHNASKIIPVKHFIIQLGFEDPNFITQVLGYEPLFKLYIALKQQNRGLDQIKEFNLKVMPLLESINDFSDETLKAIGYLFEKHPDIYLKFSPSFERNPRLIKMLYQIALFYDSKEDAGNPAKEDRYKGIFFTALLLVAKNKHNGEDAFEQAYELFNQYPNIFPTWADMGSIKQIKENINHALRYQNEIDNDVKIEELVINFLDRKTRKLTKKQLGLTRHRLLGRFKNQEEQRGLIASYVKYNEIIESFNNPKKPEIKKHILLAREICFDISDNYCVSVDQDQKKFLFKLALYYPTIARLIKTDQDLEKMQAAAAAIESAKGMNIAFNDNRMPFYLKLFFLMPENVISNPKNIITLLNKQDSDLSLIQLLTKLFELIPEFRLEQPETLVNKIATSDKPKVLCIVFINLLKSNLKIVDILTLIDFVIEYDEWEASDDAYVIIEKYKLNNEDSLLSPNAENMTAPRGGTLNRLEAIVDGYIINNTKDRSEESRSCQAQKKEVIYLLAKRESIIIRYIESELANGNSLRNVFSTIISANNELKIFNDEDFKHNLYALNLYNPGILTTLNDESIEGLQQLANLINAKEDFYQHSYDNNTQARITQVAAILGKRTNISSELEKALTGKSYTAAIHLLYINLIYNNAATAEPLYQNLDYEKTYRIINADEQACKREHEKKEDNFSLELQKPGALALLDTHMSADDHEDPLQLADLNQSDWLDETFQADLKVNETAFFNSGRLQQIAQLFTVNYHADDMLIGVLTAYRLQAIHTDYPELLFQNCKALLLRQQNIFEFIEILTADNDSPLMQFDNAQAFREDLIAFQNILAQEVFSEAQIHYYARVFKLPNAHDITLDELIIAIKAFSGTHFLAQQLDRLIHAQCAVNNFKQFFLNIKASLDNEIYSQVEFEKLLGPCNHDLIISEILAITDPDVQFFLQRLSNEPDAAPIKRESIIPILITLGDYFHCYEQMAEVFSGAPKDKIAFLKAAAKSYYYLNDKHQIWRKAKKVKYQHKAWYIQLYELPTKIELKRSFAKFTWDDRKKAFYLMTRNLGFAIKIPPLRGELDKYYKAAAELDPVIRTKYKDNDLANFYASDEYLKMIIFSVNSKMNWFSGVNNKLNKSLEKTLSIEALSMTQKQTIIAIYPKLDPFLMTYYFNKYRSDAFKAGLADYLQGKELSSITVAFLYMNHYDIAGNTDFKLDATLFNNVNNDNDFINLDAMTKYELLDNLYHLLYLFKNDMSIIDGLIAEIKNIATLSADAFDDNSSITSWMTLMKILIFMGRNHSATSILQIIIQEKNPGFLTAALLILNQTYISENDKIGIINELYVKRLLIGEKNNNIIDILIITGRYALLESYYPYLKKEMNARFGTLLKRLILHHNSKKSSVKSVIEALEFIYQLPNNIELYKEPDNLDKAVSIIYQFPEISRKYLSKNFEAKNYAWFLNAHGLVFSVLKRTLQKKNILSQDDLNKMFYVCLFSTYNKSFDSLNKVDAEYQRLIELEAIDFLSATTKNNLANAKYTIARIMAELALTPENIKTLDANLLINNYLSYNQKARDLISQFIKDKNHHHSYETVQLAMVKANGSSEALILLLKFKEIEPHFTQGIDVLYARYIEIITKFSAAGLDPRTTLNHDLLFYLIISKDTSKFFEYMSNGNNTDQMRYIYIINIIAYGIAQMDSPAQKLIDAITIIYRSDLSDIQKNTLYDLIRSKVNDNTFECDPYTPIQLLCEKLGQAGLYQNRPAQTSLDTVQVLPTNRDEIEKYMKAADTLAVYLKGYEKAFLGEASEYAQNRTLVITAFYKYPLAIEKLMKLYPIIEALDFNLCQKIIAADAKLSPKVAPHFERAQHLFYLAVFAPALLDKITQWEAQDQLIGKFMQYFSDKFTLEYLDKYLDIYLQTLTELSKNERYLTDRFDTAKMQGILLPVLLVYHYYPDTKDYEYFHLINTYEAINQLTPDSDTPVDDALFEFALKHPLLLKFIKTTSQLFNARSHGRQLDEVLRSSNQEDREFLLLLPLVCTDEPQLFQELLLKLEHTFDDKQKPLLINKAVAKLKDQLNKSSKLADPLPTIAPEILAPLISKDSGVTYLQYLIAPSHSEKDRQVKILTQYNFISSNLDSWKDFPGLPTQEQKTEAAIYLVTKAFQFCQYFYHKHSYDDDTFIATLASLNQLDAMTYRGLDLISQVLGVPYHIGIDSMVDSLIIYDHKSLHSPFSDTVFEAMRDFIAQEISELDFYTKVLAAEYLPCHKPLAKKALLAQMRHDYTQVANNNPDKIKFDEHRKNTIIDNILTKEVVERIRLDFSEFDVLSKYKEIRLTCLDNSLPNFIHYIRGVCTKDSMIHTSIEKLIMLECLYEYNLLQAMDYFLQHRDAPDDYFSTRHIEINSEYQRLKSHFEHQKDVDFKSISTVVTDELLKSHLAIKSGIKLVGITSAEKLELFLVDLNKKFSDQDYFKAVFKDKITPFPSDYHQFNDLLDVVQNINGLTIDQKLFLNELDYEYKLFKLIQEFQFKQMLPREFSIKLKELKGSFNKKAMAIRPTVKYVCENIAPSDVPKRLQSLADCIALLQPVSTSATILNAQSQDSVDDMAPDVPFNKTIDLSFI